MGGMVASALEETLDTEVDVGRVQVSWNGRAIIDDVKVKDRKGEQMLEVTRLAAKPDIMEIINGRIRIDNAQLFGMKAKLYQEHPDSATNFQFLLDALASKDTTSKKPLDLRIGQILIRRGNVTWDQQWKPETPERFNTAHLGLTDLTLTAQLQALQPDSVNIDLKRLSVKEKSGLEISNMELDFIANNQGSKLSGFQLEMPHSSLSIPTLTTHWDSMPKKGLPQEWKERLEWDTELEGKLSPEDVKSLSDKLVALSEDVSEINLQLKADGKGDDVHISNLQLQADPDLLKANVSGKIFNLSEQKENIIAESNISSIILNPKAVSLVQKVTGRQTKEIPVLNRLGTISTNGNVRWANNTASGDLDISTLLGDVSLTGQGATDGVLDLHVASDKFQLGNMLKESTSAPIGDVALDLSAKGTIKAPDGRPDMALSGIVKELQYKGYTYRNIGLNGRAKGKRYEGKASIEDVNASLDLAGVVDMAAPRIDVRGKVRNLAPHMLNLTKQYQSTTFSGELIADLKNGPLDNMEGYVSINDFQITTPDEIYRPGDLHIANNPEGNERHMVLTSPFLEAKLDGEFEYQSLIREFRGLVQTVLLRKGSLPEKKEYSQNHFNLVLNLYKPTLFQKLFGIDVELANTLKVAANMDSREETFNLTASTEGIKIKGEDLRNVDVIIDNVDGQILGDIMLQRMMKGNPVNFELKGRTQDNILLTTLSWDNNKTPSYNGNLHANVQFWNDSANKPAVKCKFEPSDFAISDTIWRMHPGSLTYENGILNIDSFQVSQAHRYLKVNGKASKSESDTLHATLNEMNLAYLFSLINFHAVNFEGDATGNVYGRSLFSSPYADAYLDVKDFKLNEGSFGDAKIHGNWGTNKNAITLNAQLSDPPENSFANVDGTIVPIKGPDQGLDLNIKATRTNVYFINKFTQAIFDNLQGRATGWAHLYGPFKQLNVEGDLNVDEASVGIPLLGVRYHLENDSVHLRPGVISFDNALLYDPQGKPGVIDHCAYVTGKLHHDHFSDLTYDIDIDGHNILGYNFNDFGDMSFYGTVLATGNVNLKGKPGQLDINIKAEPQEGTTLTYNVSTPESITQSPFMTYVDKSAPKDTTELVANTTSLEEQTSDIRINFDLDINSASTMRLLMDAKAGDYITINGGGRILARYYNKGNFQMFGTYRVERGIYKLSLQQIIRKDFTLQDGGTIVFGGNPYDADLNIQAVYTVPSVSLNDLSAKATFSNNTVRVNCLMNIGGQAREPHITFDFDIPNVNEDEKQMVRSLISTDEERNMQVIYLLGIGRFYNSNYSNDTQSQSYTAMNSLLSSTLSGQINQMLTNMVGNNNWNFGANLSTGETGWSDMDVQGLLSGRLLNNRLLINGNFGYRDNPVATSNFIGDFDVQYLLTKSGTVRLKAYSETNDRYFTKSSLTTQGIGLLLKKDFTTWRDLFRKSKK